MSSSFGTSSKGGQDNDDSDSDEEEAQYLAPEDAVNTLNFMGKPKEEMPKMKSSTSIAASVKSGSSVNSSNCEISNCEICNVKFSKLALRFRYQCADCGKSVCSKCHVKAFVSSDWRRVCKHCHSGQLQVQARGDPQHIAIAMACPAPDQERSPLATDGQAGGDNQSTGTEKVKTVNLDPKAIEQAQEAVRMYDEKHLRKLLMKGLKYDQAWKDSYLNYCQEKGVDTRDVRGHSKDFIAQFVEINMAQSITKHWAHRTIDKKTKKDEKKEKKEKEKKDRKDRKNAKEDNTSAVAPEEARKIDQPEAPKVPEVEEAPKPVESDVRLPAGRLGKAFPDASPKAGKGAPPPSSNTACVTKEQPVSSLGAREEKMKKELADVTIRKKAAVATESYSEAQKLKATEVDLERQLGGFKVLQKQLLDIEEKLTTFSKELIGVTGSKKIAISEENFVAAQELKVKEIELQKNVEALKEEKIAVEQRDPPRVSDPVTATSQAVSSICGGDFRMLPDCAWASIYEPYSTRWVLPGAMPMASARSRDPCSFIGQPDEEIEPGNEAECPVRTPAETYEICRAQLEQELEHVRALKDDAVNAEDFGRAQVMKSRADELRERLNDMEAKERVRPRTQEEIRKAEEQRRKAEEEKIMKVQRKKGLEEELDQVIAGKAKAIVDEDFAAAQTYKSREKEIVAELKVLQEEERTPASPSSSQQTWSEAQSFTLCTASEWHKHAEKAWLVDNFDAVSLREMLDQFNRGVKTCKAGFCTVHARNMEVYHVVYDQKSQEKAYSHFPRKQSANLAHACI